MGSKCNRPLRILHLHHSIGANAYNLSIGEKENGMKSTVLITDPTMYSNKADIIFQRSGSKYFNLLKVMLFCVKASFHYDVIHYNWGSVFLAARRNWLFGLDVKWFRWRKKAIAVTYQGGDARQADYCVDHYETTFYTPQDVVEQEARDKEKRHRIAFFDRYADLIYTTQPDLLNILPRRAKFRPLTKLQPEEWEPCYSDYTKKKTVILHAPTKKNVKGTAYVDSAIRRLREEGYEIEYLLLQNIPNAEVIAYYKKADLVIDQLLVGWYGGFAVECMALGKPVMCYIRETDMKYIPEEMDREMPIIRVTKDNLYQRMKYFLDHKEQLTEIARRSRKYVEKWHNPKMIAMELIAHYQRAVADKHTNR